MQDILKESKTEFDKILGWFRGEISSLRTGRATPALVEDVEVEYYGTRTGLKHIASLSAPDPRTIVIQPWDKGALESIAKAIESSSLNLKPVVDSDVVRLSLPTLTEERRKDLIKLLGEKAEEARIRSRHTRDEALRKVQDKEKAKEISEDDKFRAKNELQKAIDEFNAKLKEVEEKKEREILET